MFVLDDAAIAAAILAAEEAAAAAAASSAAGMAAGAGAGASAAGAAGAGAGAMAADAATAEAIAAAAAEQAAAQQAAGAAAAASQSGAQAGTGAQAALAADQMSGASIADAMAQTANAASSQLPVSEIAAQPAIPTVQAGADLSAAPGAAPNASITDTIGDYASKLGNTLVSPEFLGPLALQGLGSAMSYQGIDSGSDYVQETTDLAKDVVAGEQKKSNRAITDWGSDYLSPDAIQKNTDEAYVKLATDYVSNQDRARQDLGGVVGNTPDEYAKAMAGASANSSQEAADYAKKLAKAQAPAFADLNSNIGEMKANRTTADALSDMRQAGATGYNALGAVPGDPKMLGGAALRGLGSGLGTILGK